MAMGACIWPPGALLASRSCSCLGRAWNLCSCAHRPLCLWQRSPCRFRPFPCYPVQEAIEYGMIDKVLTTPMPKMPQLGPKFKFERQSSDGQQDIGV